MIRIHRAALPAWVYVVAICLGGCMSERNAQIPSTAERVAEGTGDVSYRAPDNGRVYVFDRNDDRIVFTGDVDKDQLVVVDTKNDRITVGDKVVSEKSLHPGNAHRIFFESGTSAQTAGHRMNEGNTNTGNNPNNTSGSMR